jgi:hypothetical protein
VEVGVFEEVKLVEATAQTDESTALVLELKDLVKIANPEQYKAIAEKRSLIKQAIKYHTERFKPRIDEAREHVKNLQKDLAGFVDPLQEAYDRSGRTLLIYDQEQETLKRRRELEAEAEAKRKAEEERAQLAKLAKEMGDKNLAKQIKAEPVQVDPIVVVKDTPPAKETGVSFRDDWKFEITDASKIPCAYHLIDEVKIGKVVRAMKQATSIPGIRVYSVKVPVQR